MKLRAAHSNGRYHTPPCARLPSQVKDLWRYQKRTGARVVKFNAWPATIGLQPDETACSASAAAMRAAPELRVESAKPLDASGLYRCPGVAGELLSTCSLFAANFGSKGIAAACSVTPVLTVAVSAAQRTKLDLCPESSSGSSADVSTSVNSMSGTAGSNTALAADESTGPSLK